MKAYHGNPELKAQMIAGAQEHQRLDRVIHGVYWDDHYKGGDGGGGGCAVGCTLHTVLALNNIVPSHYTIYTEAGKHGTSLHGLYPALLDIPEDLARLEEQLFEHCKVHPYDFTWPERFLAAIPVGADLSTAVERYWNKLRDNDALAYAPTHVRMEVLIEILQSSPVPEPPAPEEPTETVSELIARVTAAVEEKEAVHA